MHPREKELNNSKYQSVNIIKVADEGQFNCLLRLRLIIGSWSYVLLCIIVSISYIDVAFFVMII